MQHNIHSTSRFLHACCSSLARVSVLCPNALSGVLRRALPACPVWNEPPPGGGVSLSTNAVTVRRKLLANCDGSRLLIRVETIFR